jgi:two-component system cell cycle response regulator DivK
MDIQLPIMDGYEATRRIKADPTMKAIQIIAVTSYAVSGDEQKARDAGCDGFVPKPYSPRVGVAALQKPDTLAPDVVKAMNVLTIALVVL